MTRVDLAIPRPSIAAPDVLSLRSILFVAVLVLAWVSLHPFGDLAAADALDLTSGNETGTYALFAVFAAIGGGLAWQAHRAALRALASPALIMLAAWLVLCVCTSQDTATSARRFVLLACVSITRERRYFCCPGVATIWPSSSPLPRPCCSSFLTAGSCSFRAAHRTAGGCSPPPT
jgi:hypothetical protein